MKLFRICPARFLLPCLLAVAFCLLPNAASAEGRCPPGMFETGSRDFIACAPIPGYGQQGGEDGPGPDESPFRKAAPIRPSKPGFTAMAYHVDTASVWTSVGHHSLNAAKKRVLSDCDAATGGGCYIAEVLERAGGIYVTEDAMGQLWVKADANDKDARRFNASQWNPSIEHCLKNSFGCKFLGVHESGYIYLDEAPDRDQSANHYPKGKLSQKRWAMVARPTTAVAAQGKSWLISGKRNSAAVRKEILDRCQAESGVPCTISAYAANSEEMAADNRKVGNGLLVHFIDWQGQNRWTSAVPEASGSKPRNGEKTLPDPVTIQGRIDRICPPKLPCKIVATYDAATPRLQVIEDEK